MTPKLNSAYMLAAIKEAEKNLLNLHGGPFGACIVKNNKIISRARNTVLKHDATCHAEIMAIRKASKLLKTHDLSGCVIYSTTEPCPMCFSAVHWARIGAIIYGTRIADVSKRGFNELNISNKRMKKIGGSKVKLLEGFMRGKCKALPKKWDELPRKTTY